MGIIYLKYFVLVRFKIPNIPVALDFDLMLTHFGAYNIVCFPDHYLIKNVWKYFENLPKVCDLSVQSCGYILL